MAKRKSKGSNEDPQVVEAVPTESENKSTPAAGSTEDEALELLQVDLGDILKVKQVLDEATATALLEHCNLKEDYWLENIKLTIMFLACCFAMVAQFGPLPFPESRYILGGCCVVYFILSGALQIIVTFLEKDAIMITAPPALGDYKVKGKGIRVRTSFARFEEWYDIVLEYEGMKDSPYVKQKWSVGNLFDVEGMFDDLYFIEEVQKLCKRFEAGDYDKEDNKDEKGKSKKD